jgi:BMFP domain-containing protein YqiC|tara:strand:- start:42 stop:158 length:117 start_codon:yes stop_codon:yes gene_type:complete
MSEQTTEEKVAALESKVAELEARIVELEAGNTTIGQNG